MQRFFLHGSPPYIAPTTEAEDDTTGANPGSNASSGLDQPPETDRRPGYISQWKKSAECDAERRLIFTENPDERDILAILATFSQSHAPVFRYFVHNYLVFRPRSDCEQVSLGMERETIPLFLDTISTTYGFVDMYHGSSEPVKVYDGCIQPGYRPDPFSYGERDADITLLCPREYFLFVFEVRIQQVFIEWGSVVSIMKRIVKEKGPSILLKMPNISRVSQMSLEEKRKQQYRYTSWINEMMELLSDLMGLLSTTIDAWEEFEKRHIDLFPGRVFTLVLNIEGTFSDMRLLNLGLSELEEKLVENRDALIAHLSVENNDVAKFVKLLTVMTILFMPISVNTALFSTQGGVMPFEMNFPTFLISFAILTIMVITAWFILSYWGVAWAILRQLANGSLTSKESKSRLESLLDNARHVTTTNSKPKDITDGETQEKLTSRPSEFQRVLVGIPLGGVTGAVPSKRASRKLTKRRFTSFLNRGSTGFSRTRSVSGDIESGS
ncbi:hypothetical protein VM1G_05343 [Cytospora mali]|uniref:Magnesium transport protein CorA n=1 Tax=Cytospora mali TaxID=578113 RepID=A0A194VZ39_CYTMA|nr:hypothetical protein VM1G_05343 [Valsa mali]